MSVGRKQLYAAMNEAIRQMMTGDNEDYIAIYPGLDRINRITSGILGDTVLGHPSFSPRKIKRGERFPLDDHNENIKEVSTDLHILQNEQRSQTSRILTNLEMGEIERRKIANKLAILGNELSKLSLLDKKAGADYIIKDDFADQEFIDGKQSTVDITRSSITNLFTGEYTTQMVFRRLQVVNKYDDPNITIVSGKASQLTTPSPQGLHFNIRSTRKTGAAAELIMCVKDVKDINRKMANEIYLEFNGTLTIECSYKLNEQGSWITLGAGREFTDRALFQPLFPHKPVAFKLRLISNNPISQVNVGEGSNQIRYLHDYNLKFVRFGRREYREAGRLVTKPIQILPMFEESVSLDSVALEVSENLPFSTSIDYYVAASPYIDGYAITPSGVVKDPSTSGQVTLADLIPAGFRSPGDIKWSSIVPRDKVQGNGDGTIVAFNATQRLEGSGRWYNMYSTVGEIDRGVGRIFRPIVTIEEENIPLLNSMQIRAGKNTWRLFSEEVTTTKTGVEASVEAIYDSGAGLFHASHEIDGPLHRDGSVSNIRNGYGSNPTAADTVAQVRYIKDAPSSGTSQVVITIDPKDYPITKDPRDGKYYITFKYDEDLPETKYSWMLFVYMEDGDELYVTKYWSGDPNIRIEYYGQDGVRRPNESQIISDTRFSTNPLIWSKPGWNEFRIDVDNPSSAIPPDIFVSTRYNVTPSYIMPQNSYAFMLDMTRIPEIEMYYNVEDENFQHWMLRGPDPSGLFYVMVPDFSKGDPLYQNWSGSPGFLTSNYGDPSSIFTNPDEFFDVSWSTEGSRIDTILFRADLHQDRSLNDNIQNTSPELMDVTFLFSSKPTGE